MRVPNARRKRDPWSNTCVRDALLVTRALRHERAGSSVRLVETSDELLDRLGFDTKDEMEQWSEQVRERVRAESERFRRERDDMWLHDRSG